MTDSELKVYLSKHYKSLEACPDYLFQAYRILLHQVKDPNRRQVLDIAKSDIEESTNTSKVQKFNSLARQLPGIENNPWNWGSKR